MATYHLRLKNDTQPSGAKVSAKRHVDYILREDGKSHADYINREGAQGERTDCVFKANHLPKWAKGSAQKFFSAATRYENKGNRRYKEIELSLPNELTLEQNLEIVDRFIADHLSSHYYAYAIHEKAGELSGERHPHVHIMFSERLIDDVEKISERPAYKYFRRAARPLKGERVASFERRREHGAPKAPKWHDKKYLCEMRADFARIQNEVLAKNGFSIRVDHRSLKAQQSEAEEHGNDFLAKVYKRMPESYIGIISAHEDDGLAADVKRFRENVQKRQHSLFQDDVQKKTAEEEEMKFLVNQAERAWLFLSNSPAYKSANFEDETLNGLNQGILSGLTRIQSLKRKIVGFLGAREQAQKEYLPATDYKFLRDYENTMRQYEDLDRLSKQLIAPSGKYHEDFQAFQTIKRGVEKKFSDLRSFLAQNNSQYWAIFGKLEEPYRRKNVELVMHRLLQNDLDVLRDLKITKEKINLEATRQKLADTKIRLENELTRLENLCQTKEAKEKIVLIAADILHKNLKIALEYEEAKKRVGDLYEKLQEAKKRFNAFDDGYKQLKQNRVYRVIANNADSTKTSDLKENELAAIIADALLGEPNAVQLVARFGDNNLEMDKDWEMMLESDKDEFIRKKIIREL